MLGVRVHKHPDPKAIGPLCPDIAFKMSDETTGKRVGPGRQGEVWVKTPQVLSLIHI